MATGPRTLRRGLQVLRTLRDNPDNGLSVSELARLTGLQRPTIYRLLAALIEEGFVHNPGNSKRFSANQSAEATILGQDPRIKLALPVMQSLATQTGDAVFLVVRDGNESLSLWREIGPYPVQILATFAGKRQPLGVGSGGMALLAKLPDAEIDEIIASNSTQIEQYGGMSQRELRRLVENTRTRGYSVVGNYAVRGALGVGCALCDKKQNPYLAISVTAITDRMPATRQRQIAGLIQDGLNTLAGNV
ncbi:IclR family transcriptional regulator [Pusillimonas sp. MFBS29]|uniref:IclR family transcriptional regulator n=1 Tax=Pusillimonas sp. MFBS29 TaxID=2886690 RepID=UPI001D0FDCB8|nr:IclR family transcriptional regulator [Pusillimonas sp. MFBS29]MCC2596581.1 IclR family transcriptional regulator [Pusillimonas sp. MFBS29]